MKFKLHCLSLAFLVAGMCHSINAQSIYKINDSKDIVMKLSGTSTLHDWVMKANTFTGKAQFNFQPQKGNLLASVGALNFSLVAENLKSDDEELDKNAYKALKTDEFKDISYMLVTSKVIRNKENKYLIQTLGNLTIAGVSRSIKMDVNCTVNEDSTISCIGSEKLKMSNYNVKPPTFMFGAMKTGDAITLDFILIYKKENTDIIN